MGDDATPARKPRGPIVRALAAIVITCGLVLLGFGGGFVLFASHVGSMEEPDDPREADAIVVLTGGQSRIEAAVELLRSGKGARLLISGVHPSARREDLRIANGAEHQLFSCCVDIDRAALDTVGNAEESAKWVREHGYNRIILVTNNYHMPRSLLEMRRLIGSAELEPYPVVHTRIDRGGWLTKPGAMRVLFTEYSKYLAALARLTIRDPGAHAEAQTLNARSVGTTD